MTEHGAMSQESSALTETESERELICTWSSDLMIRSKLECEGGYDEEWECTDGDNGHFGAY